MGRSPSATLFYGIRLHEAPDLDLSDELQEDYDADQYEFLSTYVAHKLAGKELRPFSEWPDNWYTDPEWPSHNGFGYVYLGYEGDEGVGLCYWSETIYGHGVEALTLPANVEVLHEDMLRVIEVLGLDPNTPIGWYLNCEYS